MTLDGVTADLSHSQRDVVLTCRQGRRRKPTMNQFAELSLKHALDDATRSGLLESVRPTAGYALTEVSESRLTYLHQNPRISWQLITYTHSEIEEQDFLGEELLSGGLDLLGVLRFPNDFGWAKQDEALAFWTKVLPVQPHKIMFTFTELCCVYVQLQNGMIVSLWLNWDGDDIEDADAIKTIFTKIIESNQTT